MSRTLSEADSKALLARHGVPVPDERVVATAAEAAAAAIEIGFPVVAKLCGDAITHKTERGLVRLRLGDATAVEEAAAELLGRATPDDGDVGVLIAPMVQGNRELIAGLHADAQFGMTVMVGIGGVLAEAVQDVSFRLVPLTRTDAEDMLDDLRTATLLGPFRGEAAVQRDKVVDLLVGLAAVAVAEPEVVSVDLNPLVVTAEGAPVAVDALVEMAS
ncbi:MAG: acetate--CoA ligase family protein [Acidimicrobiales bacterium]